MPSVPRCATYKAADLAFLAGALAGLDAGDMLAGRLDLTRLTAAGHSFGGVAALQWRRDDPRCAAAVNLDGALWTEVGRLGLSRPVLQVLAPTGSSPRRPSPTTGGPRSTAAAARRTPSRSPAPRT